jgi:two-component system NtrC family sensor kinase
MNGHDTNTTTPDTSLNPPEKNSYRYLFRRFTLLTVVCSIVPLLLVGWGLNIHYTYFAQTRIVRTFEEQVANHGRFIEQFLKEQSAKLRLVANTHSKKDLRQSGNLMTIFENMNREQPYIMDLGVIDQLGNHLAYIGPYDLLDKVYFHEDWFKQVMHKGLYISDMFMGFRQEPHFIIAVLRREGDDQWILRATINTRVFRTLVENMHIGETGEVYLVNTQGVYQTTPRFGGSIMDRADMTVEPFNDLVTVDVYKKNEPGRFSGQVVGKFWLTNPEWMLVVKQAGAETFEEMDHARFVNLIFLHLSALSILVAAIFITRHMVGIIRKRDEHAARLNNQLMQASKLASIGELSAGVAHEINNPVAIIMTERQLLLDQFQQTIIEDPAFKDQFLSSMDQIALQSQRCKRITHNLLRFSRRTRSMIESIDLNRFVAEVVDLMERETKTSGIRLLTDLDPDLPAIQSDSSQLQQVFLNLITNAVDAHEGKPYGSIRISTRYDKDTAGIFLSIADTGTGIDPKHLDRIFDPFFTTKPVGKGTGLGLSICYSIIRQLKGNITVKSEPGEGSEFIIFLPLTLSEKETRESGPSGPDKTSDPSI